MTSGDVFDDLVGADFWSFARLEVAGLGPCFVVDAVFDATERWLGRVASMALDTIPSTSRRLATHAGITTQEAEWLHTMWSAKTVVWLVQWPVIGHGNAHVGEMISVRNRLGYSPF